MRIAFLSRHFDPQGGGAERYSVAVATELSQKHEVHVFAQSFGAENSANWVAHKIPGPLRRPRWINQLWFAGVTAWLTRKDFDVVYSHEHSWHGHVQCFHVLPIRHSLMAHRSGWRKWVRVLKIITSPRLLTYWWLEGARFNGLTKGRREVLAVSKPLQQILENTYPQSKGLTKVIPPGVKRVEPIQVGERNLARQALGLSEDAHVVLLVANDPLRKGLAVLIEAMGFLPASWRLVVAGHKPPASSYEDLAKHHGSTEKIMFLGPQNNLRTAYLAADVLAHPTLEDTYAMVVLEAMAHGTPVVVSGLPYCGISAELVNGQTAMVIKDPKDPHELARVLTQVAHDPDLSKRLREQGQAWAQQKTWAACALAHEQIFEHIKSARN
jgi:glycosyltransferase involved in cell wall biosynthesis